MYILTIYLNSIQKVKDFSEMVKNLEFDITIKSGRYVVDGKSIMGIFSMDLTKELLVEIASSSEEAANLVTELTSGNWGGVVKACTS